MLPFVPNTRGVKVAITFVILCFYFRFFSLSCYLKMVVVDLPSFDREISNISNTTKSVSSDIQTLRSGLKKRGAAEFF